MKKLLILLPLLLGACHSADPWHHHVIRNDNRANDLAKLSYPPSTPQKGIELELVRHGKEICGYLNVYHFFFPYYRDNPKHARLYLITSKYNKSFIVYRLDGGQRLRLTEHCLSTLIHLLSIHDSITIEIGHFSQTLSTQSFKHHFRNLTKEPFRFMPEELVTFEIY